MHLHIGPEIIPRKYTVEKLDKEEDDKLYGAVLKNHFYPTSPLIKAVKTCNLKMFGSVVLNNAVGGFNKEVIFSASLLLESPLVVWFPTINAENFLKQSRYEIPPEWVGGSSKKNRNANTVCGLKITDRNGKIQKNVREVLEAIKKTNSILATGHISWQESDLLIKEALRLGIDSIIITHPIYQKIDMPVEMQKKFADNGCFIEHCYSMYSIDKISIKKIAQQIKEIGYKKVILSSDVGQKFSPAPSEALYKLATLLSKEGITLKELNQMLVQNPNELIKINPRG